jgi:hypothetical protein
MIQSSHLFVNGSCRLDNISKNRLPFLHQYASRLDCLTLYDLSNQEEPC